MVIQTYVINLKEIITFNLNLIELPFNLTRVVTTNLLVNVIKTAPIVIEEPAQ